MEIIRLAEDLIMFKNAIPNHKEWVEALNNTIDETVTDWVPWTDENPYSFEQAKSDPSPYGTAKCVYFYQNNPETAWIADTILDAIKKCGEEFGKLVDMGENNPRIDCGGFAIGRYHVGMKPKGMHNDCLYDEKEFSYVFYMNDNYEGGEIEFPELNINFKPEAGTVLMFPSLDKKYKHQMASMKSGYKYMIPFFWRMGHSQGFIPRSGRTTTELSKAR